MPTACKPKRRKETKQLPQWNVILHDDPVNHFDLVVNRLMEIVHFAKEMAIEKTTEAHKQGMCILLTTHLERAEFLKEQFTACTPPLGVTIEQA